MDVSWRKSKGQRAATVQRPECCVPGCPRLAAPGRMAWRARRPEVLPETRSRTLVPLGQQAGCERCAGLPEVAAGAKLPMTCPRTLPRPVAPRLQPPFLPFPHPSRLLSPGVLFLGRGMVHTLPETPCEVGEPTNPGGRWGTCCPGRCDLGHMSSGTGGCHLRLPHPRGRCTGLPGIAPLAKGKLCSSPVRVPWWTLELRSQSWNLSLGSPPRPRGDLMIPAQAELLPAPAELFADRSQRETSDPDL